jgi:hypothetical protein
MAHKDLTARREYLQAWRCRNREKVNAQSRARRARRPEAHREYARRHRAKLGAAEANMRAVANKHGITVADFLRMRDEQGNLCAICAKPETTRSRWGGKKELAVDHNHATGKVRGLLCVRCNHGIGYLMDDPALCVAAAEYLKARNG